MSILYKLYQFYVPVEALINIYILYIRYVLQQSVVVWHSSITKGKQMDIERDQKYALRIILIDNYDHYQNALELCNLVSLYFRRKHLFIFRKEMHKTWEDTGHLSPEHKWELN